ncbi:MAG: hypothetical protein HQ517_13670 [SAR324 cluster bacterium]|nr:hypothetical protein [SAR324 cluster bacterium]
MKTAGNLFKPGVSKKKKQFDISREDLAHAMAEFKNTGGKITLIKRSAKNLDNISYKSE